MTADDTREDESMNRDQFKGNWYQLKGEIKKLTEIEGDYEKFRGKLQERYGDQKEEIEHWLDQYERKAS
jgi:uncharacterized protein YjbJ (UPF0337 family)